MFDDVKTFAELVQLLPTTEEQLTWCFVTHNTDIENIVYSVWMCAQSVIYDFSTAVEQVRVLLDWHWQIQDWWPIIRVAEDERIGLSIGGHSVLFIAENLKHHPVYRQLAQMKARPMPL